MSSLQPLSVKWPEIQLNKQTNRAKTLKGDKYITVIQHYGMQPTVIRSTCVALFYKGGNLVVMI